MEAGSDGVPKYSDEFVDRQEWERTEKGTGAERERERERERQTDVSDGDEQRRTDVSNKNRQRRMDAPMGTEDAGERRRERRNQRKQRK